MREVHDSRKLPCIPYGPGPVLLLRCDAITAKHCENKAVKLTRGCGVRVKSAPGPKLEQRRRQKSPNGPRESTLYPILVNTSLEHLNTVTATRSKSPISLIQGIRALKGGYCEGEGSAGGECARDGDRLASGRLIDLL
uniref:Uncharacterized protein n=1 Tax=Physcomitrium patens TaxID=3218 RepID=A0A2K1KH64_PHYPA|nr:hypothetical protein PHYPA_009495 [Physcomitrium patens]